MPSPNKNISYYIVTDFHVLFMLFFVNGACKCGCAEICFSVTDFWDTAGQERFQSMHPSYYHKAHACVMVNCIQIITEFLFVIILV